MKNTFLQGFVLCMMIVAISACKKQDDFLNAKPTQSLSTISTATDLQKLLNNQQVFNKYASPMWGESFTDDLYITSDSWTGNLSPEEQSAYIFLKDVFSATSVDANGWNTSYQQIYVANTVLDAIPKINGAKADIDAAKGAALFFRSLAFYELIQTYAMPYDAASPNNQLGIPLRLSSNLNDRPVRASEQQCYNQIISDLLSALELLPATSQLKTQPNKVSCNALLARVSIGIGDYKQAYQYADAVLKSYSSLFDFNNIIDAPYSLTDNSLYPLNEDLFDRALAPSSVVALTIAIVDSNLYKSYDDDDLRKTAFFFSYNDAIRFKGSYEFQNFETFTGLATDEIYLIRAECSARLGNVSGSMDDLNTLLLNRYKKGTYVKKTATSADDALKQILLERRKELCFRGLRWEDMRRLNKDPKYAVTIKRIINGTTYILPPNDPKYAMEIPLNEIQLSGIQQNPR